jgi:hypothetical protein
MRRLAIIASIIGAAAFAALLAWGLTFGSGIVLAEDETPAADETPVADETPAAEATPEYCAPVIPTTFNGQATVDGQPAADGTVITAVDAEGATWATASTSGGRYVMDVPATMPVSPPCFLAGATISFQCDAVAATETGTATGGLKDLNLTCVSAEVTPTPEVTPEVTPTPEATPTPTPTVLPPTGMGGMSGDGGFMWWPLALAAAALTSVAGLFTARWARR